MIYPPPDENPDSFAESNPYLTVDTSLFSAAFQTALLAALSNNHDLDEATDGLLIHSDNFQALNLLQARYRGQVKCIYIDPPYNTGGDGFIYKDNYQHSSWLSFLHHRLEKSYFLLSNNGSCFISVDDNEQAQLRILCNYIFQEDNFVANIIWQKKYAATNDVKGLSALHDYILMFQKSPSFERNLLPRTTEQNKPYKNDDNDGKGLWRSDNLLVKSFSQSGVYPIKNPLTGVEYFPPKGSCWRASKTTMDVWLQENRIFFGKDGKGAPQLKRYLNEVQQGRVPTTWWTFEEVGHNDAANKELRSLSNEKSPFNTPKPSTLVAQTLKIGANSDDLILDYFAGSGTTAHAVINLNREDGGRRKYILVEQGEYFDTVLKPRVQKVVYAENWKDGKPEADKESSLHGVPQIVKVLKLESYEDTLNNLVLKDNGDLFAKLNDGAKEDYLLRYMLADQSRDSLLNTDVFRRPFNYQMDIATNSAGATERMDIDLVETFNYLLGLRVHAVKDRIEKDGYLAVEGTLPDGETALVLWRDCEKVGYEGLDALLGRLKINPQDSEYDTVYINGDHNITTVWENENGVSGRLKIRQIESEFMALMFGEAQ